MATHVVTPTIQPDPSPEADFDLPPELWEQILSHLQGKHLLKVRQVCPRWKAIADGKRTLWTKMQHQFPYQPFQRECWTPATSIKLSSSVILSVRFSWWVPLGGQLTDIDFCSCTVTLNALLGMLRHTPNLERLSLDSVSMISCEEEPVGDFELLKMKELCVRGNGTYAVYGKVFPQLSSLVLQQSRAEIDCQLIKSVQGTLKRLRIRVTSYLLLHLVEMNRLHLQHLDLIVRFDGAAKAMCLCFFQPYLEELIMPYAKVQNSMLCKIGKMLPQLRQLTARLAKDDSTTSFLATMPQLKKLSLNALSDRQQPINFAQFKCPNLTELHLTRFQPIENSLQAFVSGSRNIQKLSLYNCVLESWPSLLTMLTALPSLRRLELKLLCLIDTKATVSTNQRTNLEHLELFDSTSITNAMIIQLCSLSPRIKELLLWQLPTVDDSTFQTVCRLLPQMARLCLCCCPAVTAASAEPLLDACHVLQELRVIGCWTFREALAKLLVERVDRRYIELKGHI